MQIKYRNRGFTLKRSVNQRGFTLIELLVTIGLIAVLSAATLAIIGQGPQKYARDAQRKADLQKIATALELYRNDNSYYPKCGAGIDCRSNTTNGLDTALANYVSSVPTDPNSIYVYRYFPQPPSCNNTTIKCTGYHLCTQSEKNPLASGSSEESAMKLYCSGTIYSVTNDYLRCGNNDPCDYSIANP